MKVAMRSNVRPVLKKLEQAQAQLPTAVNRALLRVRDGMKTEAYRKLRQHYTMKTAQIEKYGALKPIRSANLQVGLRSTGATLALSRFRSNHQDLSAKRPQMFKVSVKKGRLKPLPGAFIAQMKSGHMGVFKREGRKRLPIEQKFGPAVPIMLSQEVVVKHVIKQVEQRTEKRLTHEIGRMLGGKKIK